MMLQEVSQMLQCCYNRVSRMLQCCYTRVSWMLQRILHCGYCVTVDVTVLIQESITNVTELCL